MVADLSQKTGAKFDPGQPVGRHRRRLPPEEREPDVLAIGEGVRAGLQEIIVPKRPCAPSRGDGTGPLAGRPLRLAGDHRHP